MKTPRSLIAKLIFAGFSALVLIMLTLQLVPLGRNHTNPPVIAEPTWDSPRTRELFFRACADCHSNETLWPWYSNIAPVSWLVAHDVEEGREKLNISQWGQGRNEADEAAEAVQEGEMPMDIYVLLHPSANLTESETQELIRGLRLTFGDEQESDDD
ncbi:MAG: heme-binding domain-containing protein [Anaerolineales bacterium]|nr:heme-binding domain-containing protein [Anaerolineales bacterium]